MPKAKARVQTIVAGSVIEPPARAGQRSPAGHSAAERPPSPPTSPRARSMQVGFGLIFLVVGATVLYLIRAVLGAFVLGAVLAFLILPGIDWLHRHRIPRAIAVLAVFVGLTAIAAGVVRMFVPLLGSELGQLQAQVPAMASSIQARVTQLGGNQIVLFGFNVNLRIIASSLQGHVNEVLLGSFSNALSFGIAAIGTLLQVALLVLVAFLLAVDGHSIASAGRRVVPVDYQDDYDELWRQVKAMLYAYLRGQLLIAGLIGAACGIAISLLGVPYALALGVFAALTALVPYLGPFLGAIPAILVALSISPSKAALVAAAYFVISNVILNAIYPKVVGSAVKLPALLVIVAFIAGFSVGGILGMFVAVPVAATIRILFDYIHPRIYGATATDPA
ncbi:MAG: AI-2E family transporter [Candidatus Dormibacteraceae bacterium]